MTTDEDRWARAEELLRGAPGPAARQGIRRRRLFTWLAVVAGIVAAAATGLVVALLVHHPHRAERQDPPLWREITSLSLSVVGLVVIIVALVVLVRTRQFGNAWRAPTRALTRAQQKGLLRQVRGQEPVDPAHLTLARDLAERLVASGRPMPLLLLGLALGWVAQLVDRPSVGRAIFYGPLLLFWLVAWAIGGRQIRQAERFLAAHPAPSHEG